MFQTRRSLSRSAMNRAVARRCVTNVHAALPDQTIQLRFSNLKKTSTFLNEISFTLFLHRQVTLNGLRQPDDSVFVSIALLFEIFRKTRQKFDITYVKIIIFSDQTDKRKRSFPHSVQPQSIKMPHSAPKY